MNENINISEIITKQAHLRSESTAIYFGEEVISYQQLDSMIWKVSNRLYENGVRSGDIVAHIFDNQLMLFVSMLSTARLGATVFSIFADAPLLLKNEILSKVNARFISTNIVLFDINKIKKVEIESKFLFDKSKHINESIKDSNPQSPWLIISGSGTTGKSKFIPVTHSQFISRIAQYNELFDISSSDCISSLTNLDFATPKHQLLHALSHGAAIILLDKNVVDKIGTLLKFKISVLYSVVVHLEQIIKHIPFDSKKVLKSLKLLVVSGSIVTEQLRKKIIEKLTNNLCVVYGTNECWVITHVKHENVLNNVNTVGHPCREVDIEIVDSKDKVVPTGEVGGIRIKNIGMTKGYIDDEDATKKAFKDGWFYSVDLGKFTENGELIYLGRADHMMIMNGINIYPAEIEVVITKHPLVIDAAVVPMKHPIHQDIPVCAVVLDKGREVSIEELMYFSYQRLGFSGAKEMVILDSIPRTEQGKLKRMELNKMISQTLSLSKTILLMFSGGLDSTYMLYYYLKNTNYNIHVHHISLRYPSEPRWREEDIASRNIVKLCQKIRPFEYSESRVDIGFYKYVGRDSDTQLLMASKVAPNLNGKVSVALGWQYNDYQSDLLNGRARDKKSEKLWEALCNSMDAPHGNSISRELLFPLVEMRLSKREMIKLLPKELLHLTWSCRTPVKNENNISIACGKCHPCLDIQRALILEPKLS